MQNQIIARASAQYVAFVQRCWTVKPVKILNAADYDDQQCLSRRFNHKNSRNQTRQQHKITRPLLLDNHARAHKHLTLTVHTSSSKHKEQSRHFSIDSFELKLWSSGFALTSRNAAAKRRNDDDNEQRGGADCDADERHLRDANVDDVVRRRHHRGAKRRRLGGVWSVDVSSDARQAKQRRTVARGDLLEHRRQAIAGQRNASRRRLARRVDVYFFVACQAKNKTNESSEASASANKRAYNSASDSSRKQNCRWNRRRRRRCATRLMSRSDTPPTHSDLRRIAFVEPAHEINLVQDALVEFGARPLGRHKRRLEIKLNQSSSQTMKSKNT